LCTSCATRHTPRCGVNPLALGAALPGASALYEKAKQEAKAKREKLKNLQVVLARAEGGGLSITGQINNICFGRVSQGNRPAMAQGNIENLAAHLQEAEHDVAQARDNLRKVLGGGVGEIIRI